MVSCFFMLSIRCIEKMRLASECFHRSLKCIEVAGKEPPKWRLFKSHTWNQYGLALGHSAEFAGQFFRFVGHFPVPFRLPCLNLYQCFFPLMYEMLRALNNVWTSWTRFIHWQTSIENATHSFLHYPYKKCSLKFSLLKTGLGVWQPQKYFHRV